jgi:hypothetical protein
MLALTGSACLGFICAWMLRAAKIAGLKENAVELEGMKTDLQIALNRSNSERDTLILSVNNMQKLLEEFENQQVAMEISLREAKALSEKLELEKRHLQENPVEVVREVEVIKEVPVMVFREKPLPISKEEKRARLLNAFKQGVALQEKKLDGMTVFANDED